jgi:hypothetical protein
MAWLVFIKFPQKIYDTLLAGFDCGLELRRYCTTSGSSLAPMVAFDVENKMDMWFISEQQPEVVGRALRASVHIAVFHHVIWLERCDKRLTSHESMRTHVHA